MHAFLQNCPWDYTNDVELQLLMEPQDFPSLHDCVDEHTKQKPSNQANQEPKTQHVCLKCQGAQNKPDNSQ
jgi:hypothetical protein